MSLLAFTPRCPKREVIGYSDGQVAATYKLRTADEPAAIVQTAKEPGLIMITARADGLPGASVVFSSE